MWVYGGSTRLTVRRHASVAELGLRWFVEQAAGPRLATTSVANDEGTLT